MASLLQLTVAIALGRAAAVPPHVPYAAWSDPIKAGQCHAQLRLPVLDAAGGRREQGGYRVPTGVAVVTCSNHSAEF